MEYWDVDAILAEEEELPVAFKTPALKLGFLDASSDLEDIPQEHVVSLPWWLAHQLALYDVVAFMTPRFLSVRSKESLKADATCVVLRDKSPYFYEICLALSRLTEDHDLIELLTTVFSERYKLILSHALTYDGSDSTKLFDTLTHFEQTLFRAGREATEAYLEWKRRPKRRMMPSDLLPGSKRRRISSLSC